MSWQNGAVVDLVQQWTSLFRIRRNSMTPQEITESNIAHTKQFRKDLDETLQKLKEAVTYRPSRERSLAITKIQEAIMWLGMDLKAINETNPGTCPNPYPASYNPDSPEIEPTADGLKL